MTDTEHTPLFQAALTNHALMQRLLIERRTIHDYATEQPEPLAVQSIIRAGIETARWAPNHGLTEPWDFYHLGPQTIRQVAELNAETIRTKKGDKAADMKLARWLNMPEWVIVTQTLPRASLQASKPDKYVYIEREDYAACACAIQNLMLYCHSQGLGSKWSTGDVTQNPELYKLLNIDPDVANIVGMIWIGLPEKDSSGRPAKKSPRRRRTFEQVYHQKP